MDTIRWTRVAIAAAILLAVIGAVVYWQVRNNPVNNVDIDLALQGCIVQFAPNGDYEIIPFGDPQCPK